MSTQSQRFLSLDVFRGMTICFMIIVNTPGSGAEPFGPLEHADRQISNRSFLTKIFKRAALIFLIGYLMYWFPFFRLDAAGQHEVKAQMALRHYRAYLQ